MWLDFIALLLLFTAVTSDVKQMKLVINTQWDGKPIDHEPAEIVLSEKTGFLVAEFKAKFFDDIPAPTGSVGKPFPKLWDYEVVEIFFLAPDNKYLEVEVSPHGQHLLLLLNGTRNMIKDELPLAYTSNIDRAQGIWSGRAEIPLSYLPVGVDKLNAYAIHGTGHLRVYESLYPAVGGKYQQPDFHRLEYFRTFKLSDIVQDQSALGEYWKTL